MQSTQPIYLPCSMKSIIPVTMLLVAYNYTHNRDTERWSDTPAPSAAHLSKCFGDSVSCGVCWD